MVKPANLPTLIAARALSLEAVTQRRMFGGDAWLVHGKMFGFLGNMGLGVKPPPELREAMLAWPGASVFEVRPGVPFGGWVLLALADAQQGETALAALEQSYHHVRNASQEERPRRRRTRRETVTG